MISYNETKKILETLPIGYYLKTGNCIDVELDECGTTSYADLFTKKIVISFNNVLRAMPKNGNAEENIRCLLYHELSHIIATPSNLFRVARKRENIPNEIDQNLAQDLVNIFEDERIETFFHKTYYGVNFKRFVFNLNGLDYSNPIYPKAKSPKDIFYQAVRYHYGEPEFLDEIARLLRKYNTYPNSWSGDILRKYVKDIYNLYIKFCQKDTPPQNNQESKETPDSQSPDTQTPNNQDSNTQAKSLEQRELDSLLPDDFIEKVTSDTIKEFVKNYFDMYTSGLSGVKEIVEKALRKHSNKSSAINAYSGRISPRSIISNRQDYRWFTKKNNGGSQKLFDKICLNIICDESGSFASSQDTMNGMFAALEQLEKDHPEFEFNLVTISQGTYLKDKSSRRIDCCGNSHLWYKSTKKVLDSLPRSNATIKNLVLMDGEFILDGEVFSLFNSPNFKIISDCENRKELLRQAPIAKKYFCTNYATEFKTVLLQTLEETFAY